jgi:SAM-dependent methyltransferase
MLESHLSTDTEAASYKPEKIQAICSYLVQAMKLGFGDSIVDLGCGPGLYSSRLAEKGFQVTGLDRSENSIRYAEDNKKAGEKYAVADYLNSFGTACYDAALLIYQDYGVLSPDQRRTLLGNIREALKPDGYFAFDVSSMFAYQKRMGGMASNWYSSDEGFWRPHPHFILEKTLFYPDISALCDLYIVLDSEIKTYRIYQTFFSPETITSELEMNGFRVEAILSNLCGDSYDPASQEMGIICRKV